MNHVAKGTSLACPLEAVIRPVRLPVDIAGTNMGMSRRVIQKERLLLAGKTFQLRHEFADKLVNELFVRPAGAFAASIFP